MFMFEEIIKKKKNKTPYYIDCGMYSYMHMLPYELVYSNQKAI